MITKINEFRKYQAKLIREGRGNTIIRFDGVNYPTYYIEYYDSTEIDDETGKEVDVEGANDYFVKDVVGNISGFKTVELNKVDPPESLGNDDAVYFENDVIKVVFADNEWSMAVGCIPVFTYGEDEEETYDEVKFKDESAKFFTELLGIYKLRKATSAWTSGEVTAITESNDRKVYSLSELDKIESWIRHFMGKVDALPDAERNAWYSEMEKEVDKDAMTILDSQYSADKLHYHQNGMTVATGGIDTYDFITNFEDIKKKADAAYAKAKK